MRTYLVSYDTPTCDCGCVELSSTMKLICWILFKIRNLSFVRICVGIDGSYRPTVCGPNMEDCDETM